MFQLVGMAVVAALGSDDDIGEVGLDLDPAKRAVFGLVGGTVGQAVLAAQLGGDFSESIAKVTEALRYVKGASCDLCQPFQVPAALAVFRVASADTGGKAGGATLWRAAGRRHGQSDSSPTGWQPDCSPAGRNSDGATAPPQWRSRFAGHGTRIVPGVEKDGVDERIHFFSQLDGFILRGGRAGGVDAIGEEHHGLSLPSVTDLLLQGEVDGFIELSGSARASSLDGPFGSLLVAGKFTLQVHCIVERDDQHLVVDMNPVDEANGFVLDLCQLVNGAVAGVQEQSHGEGGVHWGEVGDLLLDPVLVDPEVFVRYLPLASVTTTLTLTRSTSTESV